MTESDSDGPDAGGSVSADAAARYPGFPGRVQSVFETCLAWKKVFTMMVHAAVRQ